MANGHAGRLTNGHARGAQHSATENADHAGRPPIAASDAADQEEHLEQQAQPPSDAAPGEDVFLEHEPNPSKARALESSLWEVASLRNHYCTQVRWCPSHGIVVHKL